MGVLLLVVAHYFSYRRPHFGHSSFAKPWPWLVHSCAWAPPDTPQLPHLMHCGQGHGIALLQVRAKLVHQFDINNTLSLSCPEAQRSHRKILYLPLELQPSFQHRFAL